MKSLPAALIILAAMVAVACQPPNDARAQAQPAPAPPAGKEVAYYAGGCFWCAEHDLAKIPGVVDVVSGYAGGQLSNPTYENHAGHIEAVKVVFDPRRISYRALTDRFFRLVDPTDDGGQFCDRGFAYTTAIWAASPQQKTAALASSKAAQDRLKVRAKVVTPVHDYVSFWPAEGYHQDYARKNPIRYNFYRTSCGRDSRLREVWGRP